MGFLVRRSNINEDGVWAFRVGRIGEQVEEPDLNTNLGTAFLNFVHEFKISS